MNIIIWVCFFFHPPLLQTMITLMLLRYCILCILWLNISVRWHNSWIVVRLKLNKNWTIRTADRFRFIFFIPYFNIKYSVSNLFIHQLWPCNKLSISNLIIQIFYLYIYIFPNPNTYASCFIHSQWLFTFSFFLNSFTFIIFCILQLVSIEI